MLKRSIVLFLLFSIFITPSFLLAQESTPTGQLKSEVEPQETYPGMPYYLVKRLGEKIKDVFLFFPDSKLDYSKKLLKIRFSELNYIVKEKNLEELQRASERFAYQAGKVTDLAQDNPIETRLKIVSWFEDYKQDLNQLKYTFEMDSSFWILVLHDINTLDNLTARLKKD